MPPRDISISAYAQLADSYAQLAPTKAHNALYDRPSTLALLGDVKDLAVLDLGCGTGEYTRALLQAGAATVVGLDNSPDMLNHARRNAPAANFVQASMDDELPFADQSFDRIVAGLCFDYVFDWPRLFAELFRVLRPDGEPVFSMEHPNSRWRMKVTDRYHVTERQDVPWGGFSGEKIMVSSYRRPLQDVFNIPVRTGLVLQQVVEPLPLEQMRQSDPEHYHELNREVRFLALRFQKPGL
jgi:ubiquinone/menaquinone biosynthesis C-methylase UbiE